MLRTLLPIALLLPAAAALADRSPHPDVSGDAAADACVTCHAGETPAVVAQWESSRHGLLLVKCFVCHGSTGADFVERPRPRRCEGCHAEQVGPAVPASAKAGRAAKAPDCFSCHAPHTLAAREGAANPHGAR